LVSVFRNPIGATAATPDARIEGWDDTDEPEEKTATKEKTKKKVRTPP